MLFLVSTYIGVQNILLTYHYDYRITLTIGDSDILREFVEYSPEHYYAVYR